jgi:hypothetical protein
LALATMIVLGQSEHGTARWTVSPLGRDADFFSR